MRTHQAAWSQLAVGRPQEKLRSVLSQRESEEESRARTDSEAHADTPHQRVLGLLASRQDEHQAESDLETVDDELSEEDTPHGQSREVRRAKEGNAPSR